jgi:O2-independent ubiquinone biosynthesis accessory factor UbiT
MRILPPALLSRMIDALMNGMRQRHPRLFRNLEQFEPAILHIEPTDTQRRFALAFGGGPASLQLISSEPALPNARIRGRLEMLLNLLEGRIDGDRLFFSRDIQVTGDTSIIVALRNTLDRENIDLLEDATSLCGPFAGLAQLAITLLDGAMRQARARLALPPETAHQAGADECDALRAEIQILKRQLAKAEVHNKRMKVAAS